VSNLLLNDIACETLQIVFLSRIFFFLENIRLVEIKKEERKKKQVLCVTINICSYMLLCFFLFLKTNKKRREEYKRKITMNKEGTLK